MDARMVELVLASRRGWQLEPFAESREGRLLARREEGGLTSFMSSRRDLCPSLLDLNSLAQGNLQIGLLFDSGTQANSDLTELEWVFQ